jgi:hypothetical protein
MGRLGEQITQAYNLVHGTNKTFYGDRRNVVWDLLDLIDRIEELEHNVCIGIEEIGTQFSPQDTLTACMGDNSKQSV